MFGLYAQLSVPGSLAALPVFAWELGFAGWLIARGFGPHGSSALDGRRGDRAGHAGSASRGESIRHARAS